MKITNKTRLLVIAPHPDDEAIGCGGLIGKCLKEKGKVHVSYVCIGKSRQLVTGQTDENSRLKEIEAVKKLSGIRSEVFYIGEEFMRLDMVPQKNLVEKIEDRIVSFRPDVVAIPCSGSYNQDHRAVFDAAITALRPTSKNVRHHVDYVLEYYEPYFWSSGPVKNPNTYLDLSEKFGKGNLLDYKFKLYKCHKTQVRHEPFPRSIENLTRWAKIYGKETGGDMAEAYHCLRNLIY